jgi:hypothetical protein
MLETRMHHYCRWLILIALLAAPAQANDVLYPPNSRVGMAPPPGMAVSRNFSGFESRENGAAAIIAVLPAAAFPDIEKSASPEALKKQGMSLESREDLAHPLGKALLLSGWQQIDDQRLRKWILVVPASDLTALISFQLPEAALATYPDATIRAALMTVSVRPTVPADEQLSHLPFRLGELAGFKIGGVIAGRAVMLTDGASPQPGKALDTHIMVAVAPGGPAQAAERGRFAHDVFATTPNLKDVRIETSENLRIGGMQGHQIMAKGRDEATGAEVTIVQWLRFGSGGYLHLIGVAPTAAWLPAYARFRQVRDGIDLR